MKNDEEPGSSDLGPSGYTSPRQVLRWIASIVRRANRNGCTEGTRMHVYAYRHPTEHLAVDVVSPTGARMALTFQTGGRTRLQDTDPCVRDLAEAIHLTGLIAQSLGAEVDIGMPIGPDDLALIRSQAL